MRHSISRGDLTVTVDERGAQLRSVLFKGSEYLWQGDPSYWEDQSPLLFPFVGRFTEGKYTLHGQEYHLPIHGFAKDMEFSLCSADDRSLCFLLNDTEETRSVYPYQFQLTVTYELGCGTNRSGSGLCATGGDVCAPGGDGCAPGGSVCAPEDSADTLTVTYRVHNRSQELMYFGIGGHPGFRVPLEDCLNFEDDRLVFGTPHLPARVGHSPTCFLNGIDTPFPLENGTDLPLHHEMFDEDAIVLKNVADTVTLMPGPDAPSDGSTRRVTMHYPDLPYLGLWHAPGTDAPYICIEPWTSLPSRQDIIEEFSCKSDLIRLNPDQTWQGKWSMTLT